MEQFSFFKNQKHDHCKIKCPDNYIEQKMSQTAEHAKNLTKIRSKSA